MGALAKKINRLRNKFTRDTSEHKTSCLIVGEMGAGKNHIARILHPGRRPFVQLECTAIPRDAH